MADHTSQPQFDVFLSHNSLDKPAVIELAKRLQANGIKVWLDAWELRPGHPWQEALAEIIETTRSAAVLVGADGLGPWENAEMSACLDEFVNRKLPVIPVLLPNCPSEPDLPLLLRRFTWVDFRHGKEEEGFERLIWGITGEKPTKILDMDDSPARYEKSQSTQPIAPQRNANASQPDPKQPGQLPQSTYQKWRVRLTKPYVLVLVTLLVAGFLNWHFKLGRTDAPDPNASTDPKPNWKLNISLIDTSDPEAAAKQEQEQKLNASLNSEPTTPIVEPEMVSLPGGEFLMGSDKKTDPLAYNPETPLHNIKLKPFSIGKFEVTKGEYAVFAAATQRQSNGCWVYAEGNWKMDVKTTWETAFTQTDKHPVVCVNSADAKAYANWLKEKTGKPYRLPTEAEWEYAAKAGTGTPWYWPEGETAALDYAWFADNSGHQTHPVGQKKPNAFGLFDMAGNVWEWTKDNWHDNYQGAPSDGSVWGDADVPTQVLRGGSWYNPVRDVRSTLRYSTEPDYRWTTLGFRLALSQK